MLRKIYEYDIMSFSMTSEMKRVHEKSGHFILAVTVSREPAKRSLQKRYRWYALVPRRKHSLCPLPLSTTGLITN